MEGDKKRTDEQELYEATAGWDSYVSGLLAEGRDAAAERAVQPARPAAESVEIERRRKPRDRTPSRRRSLLLSGGSEESNPS